MSLDKCAHSTNTFKSYLQIKPRDQKVHTDMVTAQHFKVWCMKTQNMKHHAGGKNMCEEVSAMLKGKS